MNVNNTDKRVFSSKSFLTSLSKMQKLDGVKAIPKYNLDDKAGTQTDEKHSDSKKENKGLKGVAGMRDLKERMQRDFIDILNHKELAAAYDILPPPVLLYGAHGCGKTFFVKKLAEELSLEFMVINPDSIASSFIHGTQEKIAAIFNEARSKNGTLLFIDEIDSMTGHRSSTENMQHLSGEVAEFLTQLNDLAKDNVFVIAATNHPENIDRAILRSGRIDSIIYVPLPDKEARIEMFQLELSKRPVTSDIDYVKLAELTANYTASDITNIVKTASREVFGKATMQDDTVIPVDMTTIKNVISRTPSSVSDSDIRFYEKLHAEFSPKESAIRKQRIGFYQ